MNPFVSYRRRLDSYAAATTAGWSDQRFVEVVERLDAQVAVVDGTGFAPTPVRTATDMARQLGLDCELVIKTEAHNVGRSHKARHLFGTALHLLVNESSGQPVAERLAIASCGNAAIAGATMARALDRPISVFVPEWADETVVARLNDLGAEVQRCPRVGGEEGDPSVLRFRQAVAMGAAPFSVQGTDNPYAFDGGRTLGWELADQCPGGLDAIFIQVGGGAFAAAASEGLGDVALHPVQAEGCAPLVRAWELLGPDHDLATAADRPDNYMWPWDNPASLATGILDDVTYDWLAVLAQVKSTGGQPVVATEPDIVAAYQAASDWADGPVSPTGTAGLAGIIAARPTGRVATVFSGIDWPRA